MRYLQLNTVQKVVFFVPLISHLLRPEPNYQFGARMVQVGRQVPILTLSVLRPMDMRDQSLLNAFSH